MHCHDGPLASPGPAPAGKRGKAHQPEESGAHPLCHRRLLGLAPSSGEDPVVAAPLPLRHMPRPLLPRPRTSLERAPWTHRSPLPPFHGQCPWHQGTPPAQIHTRSTVHRGWPKGPLQRQIALLQGTRPVPIRTQGTWHRCRFQHPFRKQCQSPGPFRRQCLLPPEGPPPLRSSARPHT